MSNFYFCLVLAVLVLNFCAISCHIIQIEDDEMHPMHKSEGKREHTSAVEDAETWFKSGQANLERKLKIHKIEAKAKNLIMFLGDGMSVSTVTASRIFKGQLDRLPYGGEEGELHMDTFPFTGASKTYCSDWQVADSACSATAYLCGTKGNSGTIGVKPSVLNGNCDTQMQPENQVRSILAWAQDAGMSTGIVTTTTVTHASPAGTYAHTAHRNWENDAKVVEYGKNSTTCDDIGEQLIEQSPGINMNVILGGGREHLTPVDIRDVETNEPGKRLDGKNLPKIWLDTKTAANQQAKYVTSKEQLLALDYSNLDYLLGLFAPNSVAFADKQEQDDDPSLAEMTDAAIKILRKNPKGFFLFVEGGRIDHAHHSNNAKRAIVETLQFDDAIQLADDKTNDQDTLIVVTSDHSHLFTLAGDPLRGNPILQLSGNDDNLDGLPFTTLAYINGPGYRAPELFNATHCVRANISSEPVPVEDVEYLQVSQVPRSSATHAGEDVLIFAKGPFAHLFTGVNDQSYIPHAMAYAACISPFGNNFCDSDNGSGSFAGISYALLIMTAVLNLLRLF